MWLKPLWVVAIVKFVVASAVDEEGSNPSPSLELRIHSTALGHGAKALAWDLSWANWAIHRGCEFARRLLRKTILKQDLEMVAGVRFELTTFGL